MSKYAGIDCGTWGSSWVGDYILVHRGSEYVWAVSFSAKYKKFIRLALIRSDFRIIITINRNHNPSSSSKLDQFTLLSLIWQLVTFNHVESKTP